MPADIGTSLLPVANEGRLRCRIILKGWRPNSIAPDPDAEVEVLNSSADAIEIEYFTNPFMHLDLRVVDSNGRLVTWGRYGDAFHIGSTVSKSLRLEAGQAYTQTVALFGNVPKESRIPGSYTIQAVYSKGPFRAVSEPVSVVYRNANEK